MGRPKGYKMSNEQKEAIRDGILNYYQTMTEEQKTRRAKANENIRQFWKIYKAEREKQYKGL